MADLSEIDVVGVSIDEVGQRLAPVGEIAGCVSMHFYSRHDVDDRKSLT